MWAFDDGDDDEVLAPLLFLLFIFPSSLSLLLCLDSGLILSLSNITHQAAVTAAEQNHFKDRQVNMKSLFTSDPVEQTDKGNRIKSILSDHINNCLIIKGFFCLAWQQQ